MIQNPINKYTVLPADQDQEPTEPTSLNNQSENSISHHGNHNEHNPLQTQQGNLIVQGEQIAITIAQPNTQASDYDDREIVHEYRDFYFGYCYKRIRKEKVAEDGTKEDEDEVEVDQVIFSQDLGLEDTMLWVMRGNFRVMMILWPIFAIATLCTSIYALISAYSPDLLYIFVFYNIMVNLMMLGGAYWQRRLYRNALNKREFKEGKRQLRGLILLPIFSVVMGFFYSLLGYSFAILPSSYPGY